MNPPVIWPLHFRLMSSLPFYSTKLAITQHVTAFSSHTNKSSPVDCSSVWMTQQHSKSALCVRKWESRWLNSLDRWPTVVLLLSTLRITRARRICRSTRATVHSRWQSLRLQWRMFSPGSLHSVSYRRDFCVIRGIDIVTNRPILLFPVAGQVLLTRAKPL